VTTVHVQLDDVTYERLRQKAAAAGMALDDYLARWAKDVVAAPGTDGSPARVAGIQRSAGALVGSWTSEDDRILGQIADNRTRSSARETPE